VSVNASPRLRSLLTGPDRGKLNHHRKSLVGARDKSWRGGPKVSLWRGGVLSGGTEGSLSRRMTKRGGGYDFQSKRGGGEKSPLKGVGGGGLVKKLLRSQKGRGIFLKIDGF